VLCNKELLVLVVAAGAKEGSKEFDIK